MGGLRCVPMHDFTVGNSLANNKIGASGARELGEGLKTNTVLLSVM